MAFLGSLSGGGAAKGAAELLTDKSPESSHPCALQAPHPFQRQPLTPGPPRTRTLGETQVGTRTGEPLSLDHKL